MINIARLLISTTFTMAIPISSLSAAEVAPVPSIQKFDCESTNQAGIFQKEDGTTYSGQVPGPALHFQVSIVRVSDVFSSGLDSSTAKAMNKKLEQAKRELAAIPCSTALKEFKNPSHPLVQTMCANYKATLNFSRGKTILFGYDSNRFSSGPLSLTGFQFNPDRTYVFYESDGKSITTATGNCAAIN